MMTWPAWPGADAFNKDRSVCSNAVPGWFRNPKLLIDSAGLLDKDN